MSSSLPEGFSVRPPTLDDVEAAAAVIEADERRLRGEVQWDAADMREWWSQLDMERNAWLVENEGRVVGIGSLMQRGAKLDGWMTVDPDFCGRGISTALVELAEARARELSGPAIRLGTFAENAAGRRLLEGLGYGDVRHYYEMRIELEGPPPDPEWPPGLGAVPFELADARTLHAAINDAFAGEWNFHQRTFAEFKRHRLDAPDFDPTLWFVVKDSGEIAAFTLCWAKRFGGPHVGLIGVREPWRRRGLGLALLRHAFDEFHRRGERRVGLGVDAENATGATLLYRRAGMHVHSEEIVYEKELP
jgi:mycothiol synthase